MATLRQTFSDIAGAIRAKGVPGSFKPIEMATKIGEIQTGGSQDYGYLTFTAEEATTLTLKQNGKIEPHKLLKSTDGVNWTKWENPSTNGISLNVGESVYLKADEDALCRTATYWYNGDYYSTYNRFSSTGKIVCSGDIRGIVKLVAPADYKYWVSALFRKCGSLTSAPELPATTLVDDCYEYMFSGCTSLTTAPELPATTLGMYCYNGMFSGCTSLTQAPSVLPATIFTQCCYKSMFYGCKSLTTAPELQGTIANNNCCEQMFYDCSSLTKAPSVLPATQLWGECYKFMFYGCKSLTSAPELPATTLATYCYNSMFRECTALKRIKMNASSESWGNYMFYSCTSLELVDMTGSTGVPQLENVNNFENTNDTYKIVVPDSLYDTWIAATNWASIASHIMKQTDWNASHPDDILGQ